MKTINKFKNNVVNAFSNGPKTEDPNFEIARKEFQTLSDAVNNTYQSLLKRDKSLKKTFIHPSGLNKNIQKYFPQEHPLALYTAEVVKEVEYSYNDWLESQRLNYELIQQYAARIKFIRDAVSDRDGLVGEIDRSSAKIRDMQVKPPKEPHKLTNEQGFYNAKKEQFETLNYKILTDMDRFFEDKQTQFDRPLQNITLSLEYLFTSIATNHRNHTAKLHQNPPYYNPIKAIVGIAPSSYSAQEKVSNSFANPPSLPSRSAPPPPPVNGGGYQAPSRSAPPPPSAPSHDHGNNQPPPPRPLTRPTGGLSLEKTSPPAPGNYPAPGQYQAPGQYNPPPTQYQPPAQYQPPQQYNSPPTQYQPPAQYQPPQQQSSHSQYQPPSQYQMPTQSSVNDMANGYATSAVTNQENQKMVGNAVANKANDPNVQNQVGSTIANNSSNPYLKSAAGNSTVQGYGGKAFGAAAKNQQVQNAAGNAAANQINQPRRF